MTEPRKLTDPARRAVDRLRDFAREHGMDFRQRDPLVRDIHNALDAFDAQHPSVAEADALAPLPAPPLTPYYVQRDGRLVSTNYKIPAERAVYLAADVDARLSDANLLQGEVETLRLITRDQEARLAALHADREHERHEKETVADAATAHARWTRARIETLGAEVARLTAAHEEKQAEFNALNARTERAEAAIRGLLRQLPVLWGDHVIGGQLTLRVEEADVDFANDLLIGWQPLPASPEEPTR